MTFNPKISIVDYLTSIWEDNSFSARKKIAEDMWIINYTGTADQNKQLLTSYQKIDETPTEETADVQKALSTNDLNTLKEAIKKYWEKKVIETLKKQPNYEEILTRLKETNIIKDGELKNNKITESENIKSKYNELTDPKNIKQDFTESNKLIEENKPKDPIFEQFEKKEFTPEELANFKQEASSFVDPIFKQTQDRATADYTWQITDINRLIQYSQSDLITDLAKTNTTFAKTMSRASKAYWQRNILWSWIQKQQAWVETDELQKSITNQQEYQRRQEEWYNTTKDNVQTQFNRAKDDLWQEQQYYTDLYSKNLQEWKIKQSIQDFWEAQKRLNFWNNTEADNPETWITTNTTPTNKTYVSQDLKNKRNLLF